MNPFTAGDRVRLINREHPVLRAWGFFHQHKCLYVTVKEVDGKLLKIDSAPGWFDHTRFEFASTKRKMKNGEVSVKITP